MRIKSRYGPADFGLLMCYYNSHISRRTTNFWGCEIGLCEKGRHPYIQVNWAISVSDGMVSGAKSSSTSGTCRWLFTGKLYIRAPTWYMTWRVHPILKVFRARSIWSWCELNFGSVDTFADTICRSGYRHLVWWLLLHPSEVGGKRPNCLKTRRIRQSHQSYQRRSLVSTSMMVALYTSVLPAMFVM